MLYQVHYFDLFVLQKVVKFVLNVEKKTQLLKLMRVNSIELEYGWVLLFWPGFQDILTNGFLKVVDWNVI